ncbi:autophagy protein atg9 [Coemansia sp. Benny D115]|nr:autophagy protein atg9 [Coemansia sp. Benny D115]
MLSNGISSRMQQFQHHKSTVGSLREREQSTFGRQSASLQRQSSGTRIPARKGLAADLINKFNQMSSTTVTSKSTLVTQSPIATAVDSSSTDCSNGNDKLQDPVSNTNAGRVDDSVCKQQATPAASDDGLASPLLSCMRDDYVQMENEEKVTDGVLDATLGLSTSVCPVSPIEPPVVRTDTVTESMLFARASPFLSDSELDRFCQLDMDPNTAYDEEENAWSTVLTTLPPTSPPQSENSGAVTIPPATTTTATTVALDTLQSYNSTPPTNIQLANTVPINTTRSPPRTERTRGLTSTLSGRRQQRHDTFVQDTGAVYQNTPPSPSTSAAAAAATTTAAADTERSYPRRAYAADAHSPQQNQPEMPSTFNTRRNSSSASRRSNIYGAQPPVAVAVAAAPAAASIRSPALDSDDEDAVPPESLLIEVSPLKQPLPSTTPVRRYTSTNTRQPTISWGNTQPGTAPERNDSGGGRGTANFVRKAAQAVRTRIQDLGNQAADAPRLGSPMPPPRHRSRETYGDGRVFSADTAASTSASVAWPRRGARQQGRGRAPPNAPLSYRERALRAWRDSKYQDEFFCRVYAYYTGKGALTMVLSRILQLATLAFVVVLSTFVFGCIDHAKMRKQRSLSEVVIPQCTKQFSWLVTIGLGLFGAFWIAQFASTLMEIPLLLEMRAFYTDVLAISPADISTVAWHEVVNRMVKLRDVEIREYRGLTKSRILGYRLTADNIVNRIMRRENYMIALFNKGLLNISIPGVSKDRVLTKALEWNLSFCLMSYLFDERGQLRHRFLKESNREILTKGLRRRFQFMAAINMMFAPFIVVFLVLYSFLRYFEELYREPGTLTSRAFTPYAKYKFRNFNEVPHSFRRRLSSAHPKATLYLSQFRNDALIAVAHFVSFIAGSFAALLIALSVFDNELSLEFEITPHRTVLFYIGLFSAILAAARGMIPTDEQGYLHPAWIIRDALEDLQYMEPEWRGKLDTTQVRRDFESLFTYKLVIFAHELLGVITAPFVMLVSLPGCAENVIDFFREFTVHESGLGYVCSFAVFDFERHGNVKFSAPVRAPGDHLVSRNGKMEQSFLAFKADYPEWQPRDQAGSLYLQRAQNAQQELWRMGSAISGAGWQGRLLQQQRMAGSIFPTGASLYRPGLNQQATPGGPSGGGVQPRPLEGNPVPPTLRSQYAFQPPGFHTPSINNITNNNMPGGAYLGGTNNLQSIASQAMLPFGPTLGDPNIGGGGVAANRSSKGKERQSAVAGNQGNVGDLSNMPATDRLALDALPLVASTEEMGNSLDMSMNNGRMAPPPGIFSIVNQLYEHQM